VLVVTSAGEENVSPGVVELWVADTASRSGAEDGVKDARSLVAQATAIVGANAEKGEV
jgi:hypothetical protein